MTIESLDFTQIRMDGGTQSRADIDDATVREYQEAMADGAEFPPPIVFYDGDAYWLADGFHRVFAWRRVSLAGRVQCDIRQGTQRDAVLYSVGANTRHGLRRTPADKRRAVLRLLNDPEWGQWADRVIADRCGVSHTFVAKMRGNDSNPTGNVASSERVYERAGKRQTMDTANIGGSSREPNYAPISRLEGVVRAWLPFRTGGKNQAAWLRILENAQEGGSEWVQALYPHVVRTVGEFRSDDLRQACRNLHDQIAEIRKRPQLEAEQETEAQSPEAPPPPPPDTQAQRQAIYEWLRDYRDDAGRGWDSLSVSQTIHASSPCRQAFIRAYPGVGKDELLAARIRLVKEEMATPPTAIEVPATIPATAPTYGGTAAYWRTMLAAEEGEKPYLPADHVLPALQWLMNELLFLAATASPNPAIACNLAAASLDVDKAISAAKN